MSSKMSISDLSDLLSPYTPAGLTFLQATSIVMERYYSAGYFKDLVAKAVIPGGTSTGYINLPPAYLSLAGVSPLNGQPLPIYSQFHEWQELSIGYINPSEMTMIGTIDMGDNWPVSVDIATAGTLRFKIYNVADVGKTVRLFGVGTMDGIAGQEMYDSTAVKGISLVMVNPTVDTTQTFSSMAPPFGGVQLPSNMIGTSELYVVNSGVATLLGRYQPGETRPCLHRYKIGVTTQDILLFCKLRFMPYRNNTDFVTPANIGALQAGLQALTKEAAMNYDEAAKLWAYGIRLLMLQIKSFMGAVKPRLPFLGRELMCAPSSVQ